MHTDIYKGSFSFGISEEQRIENIDAVFSPITVERHKKISNFLNICFCLLTLCVCNFQVFDNWNIVKIGVSFVIFDLVLCFFDNYLLNIRPYRQQNRFNDVKEYQKYIEYLEKKVTTLKKECIAFSKQSCKNCDYQHWFSEDKLYVCGKILKNQCIIFREYDWYCEELKYHKNILDKKLEEIEVATVLSNDKVSSDYEDKLAYFNDMQVKFEFLAKKNKSLNSIAKSLKRLIILLEKKPIGLTFISNSTYVYLDELQTISQKLEGLSKEQKDRYNEKFGEVAKALSESIDDINRRIDVYETGDIDVSLNVLFSELVKDTEEEDNV